MQFSKDKPLRVMVVDDSQTIRRMIAMRLDGDDRLIVVGEAENSYEAREKIKLLSPDVLTLDVEMPGMDGLEFLTRLMKLRPMPVVMISTRTREGSHAAVRALALGAVECIDKREIVKPNDNNRKLADTLLMAGRARVRALRPSDPSKPRQDFRWNGRFVFIGSSTGGVEALTTVLSRMPENCPPIVIAQHMPAQFLASFADRLNHKLGPQVALAREGEKLTQGRILIAPGGSHHIAVSRSAVPRCVFKPDQGAEYVPLIDTLMHSAARLGPEAVGVILTGMGRDGAQGLLALRKEGASTLAESEMSAVVDGMPKAARDIGAAEHVCEIGAIGQAILDMTSVGRVGRKGVAQ